MAKQAWLLTDPVDGDKTDIFREPSAYEWSYYTIQKIVYFILEVG